MRPGSERGKQAAEPDRTPLARRLRGMVTSRGTGTAGAALVLYAAGVVLGYPELCVLAAGAVLALAVASLFLLPAPRLRVRREIAPPNVARGDPAVAVVTVTNAGRRPARALSASDSCDGRVVTVAVPKLGPGASRMVSYRLPTRLRGEIQVGPLTVWRRDPFGFFARGTGYGGQLTLLVRPRTVGLSTVASGRAISLDGPAADNAPGGSTTFHALREYAFGDDLRHIHWRTTARVGTLMVRQLIDTSEPRTTVVLDTARDAYAATEDFEEAVDIAASVAVSALRAGFPVALLSPAAPPVALRGGQADADAVLNLLAMTQPSGTGPAGLGEALRQVPAPQTDGTLVVVTGHASAPVLDQVAVAGVPFQRSITVRVGGALPALPQVLALRVVDVRGSGELAALWDAAVCG